MANEGRADELTWMDRLKFPISMRRFRVSRSPRPPRPSRSPRFSPVFLVYDGGCTLCQHLKDAVLKMSRPGLLTPIPLGDPRLQEVLPSMETFQREASFHLVWDNGRVKSGPEAMPDVLRMLPGGSGPAWLIERVPGLGWMNRWLYAVIAAYRPRRGG